MYRSVMDIKFPSLETFLHVTDFNGNKVHCTGPTWKYVTLIY
jgi:hypothetical protein